MRRCVSVRLVAAGSILLWAAACRRQLRLTWCSSRCGRQSWRLHQRTSQQQLLRLKKRPAVTRRNFFPAAALWTPPKTHGRAPASKAVCSRHCLWNALAQGHSTACSSLCTINDARPKPGQPAAWPTYISDARLASRESHSGGSLDRPLQRVHL